MDGEEDVDDTFQIRSDPDQPGPICPSLLCSLARSKISESLLQVGRAVPLIMTCLHPNATRRKIVLAFVQEEGFQACHWRFFVFEMKKKFEGILGRPGPAHLTQFDVHGHSN